MKNEFVKIEEALALKELGFDEVSLCCYFEGELRLTTDEEYLIYELEGNSWRKNSDFNNSVTAPLYQQAFRFFREEYGLVCGVREVCKGKYSFEIKRWEDYSFSSILRWFDSWAVAELDCLRKLIEIVKQHPFF